MDSGNILYKFIGKTYNHYLVRKIKSFINNLILPIDTTARVE